MLVRVLCYYDSIYSYFGHSSLEEWNLFSFLFFLRPAIVMFNAQELRIFFLGGGEKPFHSLTISQNEKRCREKKIGSHFFTFNLSTCFMFSSDCQRDALKTTRTTIITIIAANTSIKRFVFKKETWKNVYESVFLSFFFFF